MIISRIHRIYLLKLGDVVNNNALSN